MDQLTEKKRGPLVTNGPDEIDPHIRIAPRCKSYREWTTFHQSPSLYSSFSSSKLSFDPDSNFLFASSLTFNMALSDMY